MLLYLDTILRKIDVVSHMWKTLDLVQRCHFLNMTEGITGAIVVQRSQSVLFASCIKRKGKLQEC
jgi:hypothetical protein